MGYCRIAETAVLVNILYFLVNIEKLALLFIKDKH